MKIHRALAALSLIAVSVLSFGCDKSEAEKAADPQAAVQRFNTEISAVAANKPRSKGRMDRGLTRFQAFAELPGKLKAVKTENLPPDLKQTYDEFLAKLGQAEPFLAELGTTQEEQARTFSVDTKKSLQFLGKLDAFLPEIQPASQKLVETGKKHGIEKLNEIMPQ